MYKIQKVQIKISSPHHNDLRKKIKIKFTGISKLDLSFQFTMIGCELKFMVRSRVVRTLQFDKWHLGR